MEPVVCAPEDPYALTEEDLPLLFEQYELLAKEMLRREEAGNGFTFYHYMLDLAHGPCIYKRIAGCGSGTEYMAVTPWGDLYPCLLYTSSACCLQKWDCPSIMLGTVKPVMGTAIQGPSHQRARDGGSRAACWMGITPEGGTRAFAQRPTAARRYRARVGAFRVNSGGTAEAQPFRPVVDERAVFLHLPSGCLLYTSHLLPSQRNVTGGGDPPES